MNNPFLDLIQSAQPEPPVSAEKTPPTDPNARPDSSGDPTHTQTPPPTPPTPGPTQTLDEPATEQKSGTAHLKEEAEGGESAQKFGRELDEALHKVQEQQVNSPAD